MFTTFQEKRDYVPTPKVAFSAKSYMSQDQMRLKNGSDRTRGFPTQIAEGDNLKPRGYLFWTHDRQRLRGFWDDVDGHLRIFAAPEFRAAVHVECPIELYPKDVTRCRDVTLHGNRVKGQL